MCEYNIIIKHSKNNLTFACTKRPSVFIFVFKLVKSYNKVFRLKLISLSWYLIVNK